MIEMEGDDTLAKIKVGFRFALAAYMDAVYPAGPDPRIINFSVIFIIQK